MFQMLLNRFLFPAPKPPHYTLTSHQENLFWLPPDSFEKSSIPCMFYAPKYSNIPIEYFIIFCHGNGCDIGSMQYTLSEFAKHLNAYIISFEYPSYGLCTTRSPNQETINRHAERTINFVVNVLHWPLERIILYGQSIGSGAACYLASTLRIGGLILHSPYTAISNLVREKVGILSIFVNSRSWNNIETIKLIKCPVLFIHGLDDTLIPPSHSEILYGACESALSKKLVLLRKEDHNSMTDSTLLKYIKPFIERQCKIFQNDVDLPEVNIDEKLREVPEHIEANRHATSDSSTKSTKRSISPEKNRSSRNK